MAVEKGSVKFYVIGTGMSIKNIIYTPFLYRRLVYNNNTFKY